MTAKKRKWLLIFFVLIPVALIFSLTVPLVFQSLQKLPPLPPPPDPNGYMDLVKAGEMVAANTDGFEKLSPPELEKITAANAPALARAQTGLGRQCRVTTQFTKDYLAVTNHFVELSAIKNLAHALAAAGKVAGLQNDFSGAAKFYLAAVAVGNESARGGILIDQLVGTATEATGIRALEKIAGQLNAKTSREVAAALAALDAQRQTWPEVMEQEAAWSRRTFPGLRDRFQAMMTANSLQKGFDRAGEKFAAQELQTRQLIIQLAARAYELNTGKKTVHLAELVPDYLQVIPQDPFTGTNIVFTP